MDKFFKNMEKLKKTQIVSSIMNELGVARDSEHAFKDAGFAGQIKDFLCLGVGFEMAIFGHKYPLVNGGIVAVIYLYNTLFRFLKNISEFLIGSTNQLANKIGEAIISNNMYRFGIILVLGVICAFVLISLFKFFFSAFVLISTIFVFVEGPARSLFIEMGIENAIAPLLVGLVVGLILMVYLEKIVRKSVLILLFATVGSALIFLGISEIFDLNIPIGSAIIDLKPIEGDLQYVLKEYVLFWCTMAVSIFIQIFIS